MVKVMDHLYQLGKRSQDWLKLKPEETADGVIIGFVEAVATADSMTHRVGSYQAASAALSCSSKTQRGEALAVSRTNSGVV